MKFEVIRNVQYQEVVVVEAEDEEEARQEADHIQSGEVQVTIPVEVMEVTEVNR